MIIKPFEDTSDNINEILTEIFTFCAFTMNAIVQTIIESWHNIQMIYIFAVMGGGLAIVILSIGKSSFISFYC